MISIGDVWECTEDFVMDDGKVSFVKGKAYPVTGIIWYKTYCEVGLVNMDGKEHAIPQSDWHHFGRGNVKVTGVLTA